MAKKIDNGAFMNHKRILSADFGSQCDFIGENAFKGCESLSQINDDNVIKSIGNNAFAGTKLSSTKFSILSTLSAGAFKDCSELIHIDIPNCQIIPMDAFNGCISLKEIELLNTKSIEKSAFAECTSLTSINIPNCTIIEQEAFKDCENLSDIYFENCIRIERSAFENCTSLNKINLNQCKKIGDNAFKGCENITQLTLSACSEIGKDAFKKCSNLSKVYINNPPSIFCSLKSKYAFCDHDDNTSDTTHNNITFYIRADTYDDYKNDSNWEHYKDNMVAMAGNNQIIYKTTDNKIIEIEGDDTNPIRSNKYFTNYGLIEFKNKIVSLNKKLFKNSPTLTSIDLPSECESIGEFEFENCKNLKSITLSSTLSHIGDYAFKNCSFESFEIPNSITELGEGVFAGCKNLKRFEGKFATYGRRAVVYNNKLICVVPKDDSETEGRIYNISNIGENILYLGKSCFCGCTNLRRIDIPSNICGINDSAFEGCENLCEMHLEGNIPPILGENVFEGVISDYSDSDGSNEFKIFVPESSLLSYYNSWKLDNIYPKADNASIIYYSNVEDSQPTTNLLCPNGKYFKITYISNILTAKTFSARTDITKVILGENILKIGAKAFKNCTNLEYIYLADNITQLDHECFCGCEKLSRIHIPIGLKTALNSIGNDVFYRCTNLKEFGTYYKNRTSSDNRCYIDSENTLSFFAQGGFDGEYTIPDRVTKIHKCAFRGSNITKINLNKSATDIGDFAFSDCVNLQSIENWDSVEKISNNAFKNCSNLKEISLPSKLATIASHAFDGCEDMYIKTNIPQSVNSIGEYAFYGCNNFKCVGDNMEEVALDLRNISKINKSTFENCKSLGKVNINASLSSINNNAFYGCENLTDLYLPDSIEYIGNSAFENCEKYKGTPIIEDGEEIYKLNIPKNIIGMGTSCFKNSGVEKLYMVDLKKLSDIPDNAFENCINLNHIDINTSTHIKTIGSYAFNGCTNLCSYNNGNLELNSSINTIGDYAFNGCKNILSVTLPITLKKMGNFCLATENGSTSIYIPMELNPPTFSISGTDSIESYPFGKFENITEALNRIPEIYIYKSYINTYKNNNYWGKYSVRFNTMMVIEDCISYVSCETNRFNNEDANNWKVNLVLNELMPTHWVNNFIYFSAYDESKNLLTSITDDTISQYKFRITEEFTTGELMKTRTIITGISACLGGTSEKPAKYIKIEEGKDITNKSKVPFDGRWINVNNV